MIKAKLTIVLPDVKEIQKIDEIIEYAKGLKAEVFYDDLDLSA